MQTKIKNKDTSLRCFVRFNNERAPFLTDVKVEPRYFDKVKQRAVVTSRFDGSDKNERLDQIKRFVDDKFLSMTEFPDPVAFSEECERFVKSGDKSIRKPRKAETMPTTLMAFIKKLALDSREGRRKIASGPRKGQRYKPDSLKSYDSVVYVLNKFAESERVTDFPFNDIDEDFYERFSSYYYNVLKKSVGYFSTVIKIIKTAMNESKRAGLHINDSHNSRSFIKPAYESDTVSLDLSQLKQLQDHVFKPGQEDIEHARDLFLVGCWTGLRFEDFTSIRKQDIHHDFIRIKTGKTSERVSIPIHPMLSKIFKKYGGGPPAPINNVYLNRDIKIACRKAKLTQTISVRVNKAGLDVIEEHPLYKLVSTHTARRSFASNMFRQGIPTLLIMAITGHKTEKAFLKYIRIGEEEKSRMMAERWKQIQWE